MTQKLAYFYKKAIFYDLYIRTCSKSLKEKLLNNLNQRF